MHLRSQGSTCGRPSLQLRSLLSASGSGKLSKARPAKMVVVAIIAGPFDEIGRIGLLEDLPFHLRAVQRSHAFERFFGILHAFDSCCRGCCFLQLSPAHA